ncbi:sensor histidine kinase [Pedobacter rhodius]|uniref:histidine kinase n=1 Tax=Pedobacter rhodius TaxID=3004098 RepID=A0ABT4L0Y4_9SPHI|nr:MASE3 domain-containing protein [Pedobacter sp. SJ11]MCZ4224840.1 ATP-binding protein [Pedobacter sp. SJ11]
MSRFLNFFKANYRTIFVVAFLVLLFQFSKQYGYILFHTLVELFSIVIAFAVFIVAWNSRYMQDNKYLHLVGISYIFIGALDLLHTLTYKGMNIIPLQGHPANQFWVSTRFLEAVTLLAGFTLIERTKKINTDLIFIAYFFTTLLIIFLILIWQVFPVCFIDGVGQTPFKIFGEYVIIAILLLCAFLLIKKRLHFSPTVYRLLLASVIFTILSECCFATYISIYGPVNEMGHYGKLIAFFLIYKANVETGFVKPTDFIFKNLKENEEKYRTLAENLPGLILRFDREFKCIYSNKVVVADELTSQENALIFAKGDGLEQAIIPRIIRAKDTGVIQQTNYQQKNGDNEKFYSIQVIPEYGANGIGNTFLVICQDISALKHTEKQLQLINHTKDKLFSVIAHDLKNPFTSLISYSELIANNADRLGPEKIGHMAQRMNESAKLVYTLLENLLSWSRVQSGLLKARLESVNLDLLLESVKKHCTPQAQAKDILIKIDTRPGLTLLADNQMSATILRNLISNAIKFSFPGNEVHIKAEQNNSVVKISVHDCGTGISEEHKGKLLELTNTFSSPGTAAEVGTGLGLVLCREFAELNNGTIYLESELGVGTTFFLLLPAN